MSDSWRLRELFRFDSENVKIFNDTDGNVEYIDPRNISHNININGIIDLHEQNEDFNIPNFDILKYSDRTIHESVGFQDNLQIITRWYRKQICDGQIKQGIEFLEYHYKWTKRKKDFISFVNYYFLSKYWLPKEQREKDWLVEEWVKSKEKELEKPKYIWILIVILSLLILGVILLPKLRELLIGAMLGLILGRVDKVIDKIIDTKKV